VDPGEDHRKTWCCIGVCVGVMVALIVGIVSIVVFARRSRGSNASGPPPERRAGELSLSPVNDCKELILELGTPATQLGRAYGEPSHSQWFSADQPWITADDRTAIQGGNFYLQVRLSVRKPCCSVLAFALCPVTSRGHHSKLCHDAFARSFKIRWLRRHWQSRR
jgi:hypothetical protein